MGLDSNGSNTNLLITSSLTALGTDVTIDCAEFASIGFQISGTWVGDIFFFYSMDGSSYDVVSAQPFPDNAGYSPLVQDTSGNGSWRIDTASLNSVQLYMNSYTSGTADVVVNCTPYPVNQAPVRIKTSADEGITLGAKASVSSLPVVIATDQSTLYVNVANGDVASAVPIRDGGNSITVDNGGTFAVQAAATLGAETTKVIGTVNIAASQTIGLAAGAAVIGHVINDASSAVIGHVINDAGSALIGKVGIDQTTPGTTNGVQVNAAIPAGNNNIGDVDVASIAAGDNNIGNIDVVTLPAITIAAAQTLATVTTVSTVSAVTAITNALPAGANTIGALTANQSVNNAQINGVTPLMGNGASGTGAQRVTIADDSTGLVKLATGANTIGALTANQSINNAQVNGGTVVTSVTGVQDVMPRKRNSTTGLSPNYYAARITSKTTTTPTAATAYVSAITFACSAAGTAWTFVIQNKEGTPKILVPSITLTVPVAGPVIMQFAEPILMTSGIDIVTGGTTAGTVDVFMTYWN